LIRSACATARWSIQTMMLRAGSSDGPTGSGRPSAPSTTSEQVASKPMPFTCATGTPAAATASRTEAQTASQICSLDCSAIPPGARQSVISRRAEASIRPPASNTPARALPVPTSTPIK
jgi:hypothetical protein